MQFNLSKNYNNSLVYLPSFILISSEHLTWKILGDHSISVSQTWFTCGQIYDVGTIMIPIFKKKSRIWHSSVCIHFFYFKAVVVFVRKTWQVDFIWATNFYQYNLLSKDAYKCLRWILGKKITFLIPRYLFVGMYILFWRTSTYTKMLVLCEYDKSKSLRGHKSTNDSFTFKTP